MKHLFLLCDGIADHPIETSTPLSPSKTAHTPCMDYLAARSLVGMATLPAVVCPPADGVDEETETEETFLEESTHTEDPEDSEAADAPAEEFPASGKDANESGESNESAAEPIDWDALVDSTISRFRQKENNLSVRIPAPATDQDRSAFIETIDEKVLKPLYEYLRCSKDDFKILLLSEGTDPTDNAPLPFFLYSSKDEVEGPAAFTEQTAAQSGLQIPRAGLADILNSKETQKSLAHTKGVKVKNRTSTSFLLDWIELVGIALVTVILLMTLCFRHSPVIGSSMYPTLIGSPTGGSETSYTKSKGYDVLLISDLFYTPSYGDIVIIQTTRKPDQPLVKRIIATEGQHIKIDFANWKIWIDGKLLEENYINYIPDAEMESYDIGQVFGSPVVDGIWEGTVPQGHIFVLGDNRNNSSDSRSLGYIDTRLIVGRVVLRLSPSDRFGKVD